MMRDFRPFAGNEAELSAADQLRTNCSREQRLLIASRHDLLAYFADLIGELHELAGHAEMEGVADLLGVTRREIERNRKLL